MSHAFSRPLDLCDLFLSSAEGLLASLKRSELLDEVAGSAVPGSSFKAAVKSIDKSPSRRRSASPPSAGWSRPDRRAPSNEYVAPGRRRRGRDRRVRFAAPPLSAPPPAEGADWSATADPAHWEQVRQLCGRLMAAQALLVAPPGRRTQQWAARSDAVTGLARQLAAAVLTEGRGRLGGRLVRVQRLLQLLGRLTVLPAFGPAGGVVVLCSVAVLSAAVAPALAAAPHQTADDALTVLQGVVGTVRWSEAALRRPDQPALCVDPLERRQMAVLFAVRLAAVHNPCSPGPPATLGALWRRLLERAGWLYSRQRARLSAERRRQLCALLGQLQRCVRGRGLPLVPARLPRRTPALRRYLSGDWDGAARQLGAQLSAAAEQQRTGRLCRLSHSLLYLHLSGGRLRRALEAADRALGGISGGEQAAALRTAAQHPAGRRLLASLARLMARYHLPAPLTVAPPHVARPEPSLLANRDDNGRRSGRTGE